MTWNEEIEARGVAKGLARGEAQGIAKGQQRMFLDLLQQRFPTVSDAVRSRVQTATVDELTAWTSAFFRASSPEDLVGL